MVRSLFIWSRDLWNGERGENSDLKTAKYVFANAASTQEKKEWPFCSLYYEENTADDNGLTPIAFAEKDVDFDGKKLTVKTVRCTNDSGNTIDFTFPDPKSISQDYDLRSAGSAGQVNYIPAGTKDGERQGGVTFHVDEIMEMNDSAEKNREKVKDFLAKKIDEKISSAMGGENKNAETFGSEYSVERVNPTVVSGAEDVRAAETFASEGCGCSGGNCMCAESYEADGETEMVGFTESPVDVVLPEGEGNVIGQSTPTTDFTPFGSRAEGFGGEGFATEGFYPEGDGRAFGDITADADYTPLGARAEKEARMPDLTRLARIPEARRSRRMSGRQLRGGSLGSYGRGFGSSSAWASEEDNFYPDGDGRIIGAKTSTTEYEPFGSNAEDDVYPEGDGRITGQSISTTDFTPLGTRAEGFKGGSVLTGVASAFVVGLLANLLMNKTPKDDAPDGPKEPENGGE